MLYINRRTCGPMFGRTWATLSLSRESSTRGRCRTEENGRLWVFDQARLRWSSLEPADPGQDVPEGRSYHALANDGEGKLYLHAGCAPSGRLSDLWSFDLQERTWRRLHDTPGPARGGACLAFAPGKLWRMHGFDGTREQGLAVDVFDPASGAWETRTWDARSGPVPRSVRTLLPVRARSDDGEKEFLVTMFGERSRYSGAYRGWEDVGGCMNV